MHAWIETWTGHTTISLSLIFSLTSVGQSIAVREKSAINQSKAKNYNRTLAVKTAIAPPPRRCQAPTKRRWTETGIATCTTTQASTSNRRRRCHRTTGPTGRKDWSPELQISRVGGSPGQPAATPPAWLKMLATTRAPTTEASPARPGPPSRPPRAGQFVAASPGRFLLHRRA
jgi:hypothetical protein